MKVRGSKRHMIIYVVIFLWAAFACLGLKYDASFTDMTAYFLSLTGFVSAYVWGESVRPAESSSLFKRGATSTRELMIYVTVLLWTITGVIGTIWQKNLTELAAYFAALTPFVGAYIIGASYKKTEAKPEEPKKQDVAEP